jgi:2,4-dienoyl-CoA reductase-like NADH-dependent reductase (Old Yellow Enzyme family)
MSLLFEPFRIGSIEVKNRFIRSATTSYWSDKRGIIRSEIIDLYRKLARGGVGLIIKGHLYVMHSGKAHVGMAGISDDLHIPQLKKLTSEVHKNNGKIIAQLNHGGLYSVADRAGPSAYVVQGHKTRALSTEEIYDIVKAFSEAAERALVAGFDGVQIHGAHGYLISQFLSRLANRRTDEWGGNLKNRVHLLLEIYNAIRGKVGNHIPVMLKINCDDFSPNGFSIKDSVKVVETICRSGIQAIEVSGGGIARKDNLRARARSLDQELTEASFAGHATEIRKAAQSTPMALVNGIRSVRCMEAILGKNVADFISMSRPFIKEPDFVKRIETGQEASACTSCNICISKEISKPFCNRAPSS